MKKLFLMLIIIAVAANVSANTKKRQKMQKSPENRAKTISTKLTKELSLSKKQKEQVYELFVSNVSEKKEKKKKQESSSIADIKIKGEQMYVKKEVFDTKLRSILGDEKYISMLKMRIDQHKKSAKEFKGRMPIRKYQGMRPSKISKYHRFAYHHASKLCCCKCLPFSIRR